MAQSIKMVDRCRVGHGVILGDGAGFKFPDRLTNRSEWCQFHSRTASNTKVGYRGWFDGSILGYQQLQHAMFCKLICRFKPWKGPQGPREKGDVYAPSTWYRIWNDRCSTIFRPLESECLVEEACPSGTHDGEPSRDRLTKQLTDVYEERRGRHLMGAVLFFRCKELFRR